MIQEAHVDATWKVSKLPLAAMAGKDIGDTWHRAAAWSGGTGLLRLKCIMIWFSALAKRTEGKRPWHCQRDQPRPAR